eukprot:CAMPEP_0168515298 /NCGR_PEP_ID=MMETSP0405-20121227/4657_1 /TAXON_ID=498012 /ORGANISM="Trichosphaerium sp, Strain Am-I-7 wt" /LENGTH=128 /DNA_ID=CAMNT_0008534659 /DNA_START=135 /DNA_END=521 /DNA_ORIENTATION=+
MATRPKGYGLTAEVQAKRDSKYSQDDENMVRQWIAAKTGQSVPSGSFQDALKDGVILCNLAMKIGAGSIRINTSKMAFKQMENIGNFIAAIERMGIADTDRFTTADLYDGANMLQVLQCLITLKTRFP